MKRALLTSAAALILAVAAFTTANAQGQGVPPGRGGGGGAPAARSAPSGGGGPAISRSVPSGGGGPAMQGGGPQIGAGNFGAFRGAPSGGFRGEFRGAPFRGGGPFVARRHFRGPIVGFGAPYYSDYGYYDNGCYELHRIWTRYGWRYVREWVCD